MKPDEFRCVSLHVYRPVEDASTLTALEREDLMNKAEVAALSVHNATSLSARPEPTVEERLALTHELRSKEHSRGAAENHGPVEKDWRMISVPARSSSSKGGPTRSTPSSERRYAK